MPDDTREGAFFETSGSSGMCAQFLLSNKMSPVYDVFEFCLVKADPELANLATCENDLRDSVEERVAKREKWVERATALVKKVEYRKVISQYNPYMEQPEVIRKGCNFILVSTCYLNFNWNDIEFYRGEDEHTDFISRLDFDSGPYSVYCRKPGASEEVVRGISFHVFTPPERATHFRISVGQGCREATGELLSPRIFSPHRLDSVNFAEEDNDNFKEGYQHIGP